MNEPSQDPRAGFERLRDWLRFHANEPHVASVDAARVAYQHAADLIDAELASSSEDEPITEDWLRSVGFKWHQFDRQPAKQWLLWIGQAAGQWGSGCDDLGVELAPGSYDADRDDTYGWFCWLRSDSSHRYSRFIHVRRLRTRGEVIRLVEGLTGQTWNPELHLYGSVHHPKHAKQLQADRERLDKILAANPTWYESEKDESRGRPLREHLDAAIKNGGAK